MTPITQFVDQNPRAASAPCGGCILFDVGVSRTFTLLAYLANARARGMRRPVILVPRSLAREVMP